MTPMNMEQYEEEKKLRQVTEKECEYEKEKEDDEGPKLL